MDDFYRYNIASQIEIVTLTCLLICSLATSIPFGIYYFNNPDLITNDGKHCYANGHDKNPVKADSPGAIDVTQEFLTLFELYFI